jgi:hypothetical protein
MRMFSSADYTTGCENKSTAPVGKYARAGQNGAKLPVKTNAPERPCFPIRMVCLPLPGQILQEGSDIGPNQVANRSQLVQIHLFGVGDGPINAGFCLDVWALVAATHCDGIIVLDLGNGPQAFGIVTRQVVTKFRHQGNRFGVYLAGGAGTGAVDFDTIAR